MPYAQGNQKICSHCRQVLPLSAFNKNKGTKDGVNNQCRECSRESMRRSAAKNRGFWHAKHRYGLTSEEYEALLASSDGGCHVCGSLLPGNGRKRFDIDHDHATGKVRGLLCRRCNLSLAEGVTPATLRLLADYLEGHNMP